MNVMIDHKRSLHPPREDELTILLYHGVTDADSRGIENFSGKHIRAETFRSQMEFVEEHAHALSIDELVAHHHHRQPLPPRSVVISFDDGFRNNYTAAAPILDELRLPAVFYITSGMINTDLMFWVDELEDCINLCPERTIIIELDEPRSFALGDAASRIEALTTIKAYCKGCSAADKDRVVAQLEEQTGVAPAVEHAVNYRMMSWSQLRELDASALFTVGGHSLYHDILSSLPRQRMRQDVELSMGLLAYHLGHAITHYSYPEGQRHHYDQAVIDRLVELGIVCSPSAVEGYNTLEDDLFHLRRVMVGFMGTPFPFPAWQEP